ncbi:MAG: hypothetical protein HZA46_24090 [Planctomycetales bacterium]|nr:hypothetical protein [Planctomycetales bacterium]
MWPIHKAQPTSQEMCVIRLKPGLSQISVNPGQWFVSDGGRLNDAYDLGIFDRSDANLLFTENDEGLVDLTITLQDAAEKEIEQQTIDFVVDSGQIVLICASRIFELGFEQRQIYALIDSVNRQDSCTGVLYFCPLSAALALGIRIKPPYGDGSYSLTVHRRIRGVAQLCLRFVCDAA